MRLLRLLGATLILGTTLPAAAAEQRPGADAAGSKGRLVCFAEPVTGSHMKKKICMTEEERERRRREDQDAARNLKRPSAANNPKEKM